MTKELLEHAFKAGRISENTSFEEWYNTFVPQMKKYAEDDEFVIKDVPWTKYKIIVPTEEDRQELMKAFRHIHDSDVDSDNIAVNQLIHEYNTENGANNIIVDADMYEEALDPYYVPDRIEFVPGFEYEQYIAGTDDDYMKKTFGPAEHAFVNNVYNGRLEFGWIRRLKSMKNK